MKSTSGHPEFIQGSLFEGYTFSLSRSPEIAFSALQQIQRLRAKNKRKDAASILKEWILS